MAGLYRRFLFPRLLESSIGGEDAAKERAKALEPVYGEVLEVGFGTGLNLRHYPSGVRRLVAVDPEELLPQKVAERIAAAAFPVELIRHSGERLPFGAARFDCVVTTWTLCTIADPAAALRELRRVLKPAGKYVFCEHGRSADPRVARLQDWINPFWRLSGIACGCTINRRIDSLISQAGFRIGSLERYVAGRPRIMREMYRGVATHDEVAGAQSDSVRDVSPSCGYAPFLREMQDFNRFDHRRLRCAPRPLMCAGFPRFKQKFTDKRPLFRGCGISWASARENPRA